MLPQIFTTACRYIPLMPQTTVINFNVNMAGERLSSFEKVAICGDHRNLGNWNTQNAILLKPSGEQHMWEGNVEMDKNTTVSYRYFIVTESGERNGGMDVGKVTRIINAVNATITGDGGSRSGSEDDHEEKSHTIQVRRWESHMEARSVTVGTENEKTMDNFGYIDSYEREVKNGWLDSGNILQFKIFGNALEIKQGAPANLQLRLKVEPVDADSLVPIMPSAQANVECAALSQSDCFLRDQTEYGVPYKVTEMLIFHTELTHVRNTSYLLKLFGVQTNNAAVNLISYQYIFANDIVGSEGTLTLSLLSPVWLTGIGKMKLQYLVVTPMPNFMADLHFSLANYWNDEWKGLDGAHRGMGISFHAHINHPKYHENTLASFMEAANLPVDMIEFDVMLTSDMEPIVFHDFEIYVSSISKPKGKEDLTTVMVKDFTYAQLLNMNIFILSGTKVLNFPPQKYVENSNERLFPLLEEVLQKVTKCVSFDIEVKWPQMQENGEMESMQSMDKNEYVDRILAVVRRYAGGRLIFLTSFDADVCTMMRYKQNMYPVMYITPSRTDRYEDPRSHDFEYQIHFTQAFGLLGVVANTEYIATNPQLMRYAEKRNKKVFLWGEDLRDSATIAWFKKQGVVGCIYDRVDLWLPVSKQRVLLLKESTDSGCV